MGRLSYRQKIWILVVMFVVAVAGLGFLPPIPQDPAYHDFADKRPFLGIPNFGDVTSNGGFAVVGLWGLWWLSRRGRAVFVDARDARPYLWFFVGVALVSLGSATYHWNSSNETLFWDRLPMTVAFMALFSALVADRVDHAFATRWLLPILLVLGVVSVLYWKVSEITGHGDLRLYALVQFYPLLAAPVICGLFRPARYTGGGYIFWVIAWYLVAKVAEHFDHEVFVALGGTVSGHSLKHLAAAAATFVVLRMLATAAERMHRDAMAARAATGAG